VTRIVAGAAKGRRLVVPARGTRPTSDRAREALFSTLAGLLDLDGARVLDLYAGTGAVGLEALSRGAGHVTFVESDRTAAAILRRNVETVGLLGAQIVISSVEEYLADVVGAPFDLVYLDPPYALDDAALGAVLAGLDAPRWLVAGAVVVVERPAQAAQPRWPDVIQSIKQRRYGAGVLWYGRVK
jgi:16S rRNA (guanine966-N2)-methyltransferase